MARKHADIVAGKTRHQDYFPTKFQRKTSRENFLDKNEDLSMRIFANRCNVTSKQNFENTSDSIQIIKTIRDSYIRELFCKYCEKNLHNYRVKYRAVRINLI